MPFFLNSSSYLKKLSSEYQLYTCGNFFRIPRFEKKLLFSDSLLESNPVFELTPLTAIRAGEAYLEIFPGLKVTIVL